MALSQAWVLWVALAVAIAAVGGGILLARRRDRRTEREAPAAYVSRAERVRALPSYTRALRRRRAVLAGLVVVGLAALAVGAITAARPVAKQIVQPENTSRDIMLCLDVSGSMTDVDVETIEVFEEMLPELRGERIGLTIFNSSPVQVFPLTDDYAFIERELARVKQSFDFVDAYPEHWAGTLLGSGSSLIGDGFASCVMRFDHEGEDRSRSVILATDNEELGAPVLTLQEAADLAASRGVRGYSINPAEGVSEEQAAGLSEAMERTGGEAYGLQDTVTVAGIVADVQAQEARALQGQAQMVETDDPNLWIALFAVGGLVVVAALWRLRL
ncbi:hypothetical protein K8P10_000599 [Leucobacter sp. Psy1]|uniref:VWA domain-containing protein n=1 Tax=Leucobacter sp. Psy1 TaxID=2875729 RepID=UPI001CD29A95|nr:VWA domain-containing protein [Leucobacter sp. Psy1]UBH05088.1 hypothetical protein K8P10_000599 [Leucobacter sp. Psy1]